MATIEANTHAFVVKVWLEETAAETGYPVWRGHVTHVASNQQQHFTYLGDVTRFILAYTPGAVTKPTLTQRWRSWLRKMRHKA
jgi:hypothetical protein